MSHADHECLTSTSASGEDFTLVTHNSQSLTTKDLAVQEISVFEDHRASIGSSDTDSTHRASLGDEEPRREQSEGFSTRMALSHPIVLS